MAEVEIVNAEEPTQEKTNKEKYEQWAKDRQEKRLQGISLDLEQVAVNLEAVAADCLRRAEVVKGWIAFLKTLKGVVTNDGRTVHLGDIERLGRAMAAEQWALAMKYMNGFGKFI